MGSAGAVVGTKKKKPTELFKFEKPNYANFGLEEDFDSPSPSGAIPLDDLEVQIVSPPALLSPLDQPEEE